MSSLPLARALPIRFRAALTAPATRTRLLGLAAAVLLAEGIGFAAQALFGVQLQTPAGTLSLDPHDLAPLTIALASLVPSLAGWAVLAGLTRLTAHGRRVWLGLALGVLIASMFGPLSGTGVSVGDRIVLMLMHLAVASTIISVLYRTSTGRRAHPSQLPPTSGEVVRPAKGSHAAHRPPLHTDPRQSTPPLVFGVLYPHQDVVAVIDDLDQAHRAEAALHSAGIADEDSDVLEPAVVLQAKRSIDRRRGWLGRLAAGASELVSDDSNFMQTYWEAAERGHSLLVVHAPTPAIIDQVRQVLGAHGARGMRHYGRLTVTEL